LFGKIFGVSETTYAANKFVNPSGIKKYSVSVLIATEINISIIWYKLTLIIQVEFGQNAIEFPAKQIAQQEDLVYETAQVMPYLFFVI
jgi:hypothetical protein